MVSISQMNARTAKNVGNADCDEARHFFDVFQIFLTISDGTKLMTRSLFVYGVCFVILATACQIIWAGEPTQLRVLTYNINHGGSASNKLSQLADIIKRENPDLVALQEVDNKVARSSRIDQAASLGKMTGMHAFFGKATPLTDGQYGVAILSRDKPVSVENHPLPSEGVEPRTALAAQVVLGKNGPTIVFIVTHLALPIRNKVTKIQDSTIQESQVQDIVNEFVKDDSPIVLAGDLNALPDSPSIKALLRYFSDASTNSKELNFPSKKPNRKIDYVLYHPANKWRVVKTRVLDEPTASDHRPLLVVLELNQ